MQSPIEGFRRKSRTLINEQLVLNLVKVIKFTFNFKFLVVKLYFIVIHVLELRMYGFGL